ncbi:HTTM domain-containing protein [Streptomyces olivaceus]|uniref:HTTM domain-containing protein n=1 Tax=Streptomyces olivaceus TaxID=47716 RepID=A0ABS7WE43_STROV|nr:HTTM domain-containing protein [Streptomyces olivaceus]MBZ6093401.1 HTTM domain-containing protein [Streptomyces olivaceus]MBZ6100572.1 HTTM domain-containing protein [Streptomyces olivaceus]MBZ6121673.1 HTTM domain-containing protein [Streptomyces olivaceus]MBZ6156234.1 HTTM domain-containing protein [Streptomyces olivaceus]MBZ6302886.1 HTTM domain-containing protein [Streptomyces olivaceus]
MKKIIAAIDRWSTVPVSVVGVSGTRTLLGFVGLMFYVSQYADRDYLFGPQGALPWEEFSGNIARNDSFSLYALSSSEAWFQIVFHLGMIVALLVVLGVGGRIGLALHWVFLWSIYERQTVLLDGGDNLAYLVIPMLLLTRCYDRFSLSAGLRGKLSRHIPEKLRSISTPLHNIGVLAIILQICLVYIVSGLYKVQGKMWQDGTALFYVLRVPEFTFPGLSHLIYENDFLVVAGTFTTVIFLVYFPLGIMVPALRPWAAVMSIGFHLGIALLMGLTGFALTMVACDLVFLSRGLDEAASHGVRLIRRMRSRPPPGRRRPSGELSRCDPDLRESPGDLSRMWTRPGRTVRTAAQHAGVAPPHRTFLVRRVAQRDQRRPGIPLSSRSPALSTAGGQPRARI